MPDLFTIWHWRGEISSNVTFACCTKWSIVVAVLRGRQLTHVSSLSMHNLYPFIAFFFLFSSQKLAERLHKGKKVR